MPDPGWYAEQIYMGLLETFVVFLWPLEGVRKSFVFVFFIIRFAIPDSILQYVRIRALALRLQ